MKWMIAAAALGLAACSTTSMISEWKKPGAGPLRFDKVAVIAPVSSESMRRSIEDQVAGQIRMTQALPSYRTIEMPLSQDRQQLRDQLEQQGFDGAVVVRITSVDKEATWVPGSMPYYGFGAWPMYDPGYVTVDTYVRVETNVYSVKDNELLFAATSRTANPSDMRQLIDETVKAVRQELQKEGMVPPTPVSQAQTRP